jgi:hypothetical protein
MTAGERNPCRASRPVNSGAVPIYFGSRRAAHVRVGGGYFVGPKHHPVWMTSPWARVFNQWPTAPVRPGIAGTGLDAEYKQFLTAHPK